MKISDMLITALVKKGVLYEARNVDTDVDIPSTAGNIKVHIKCDHMTLKIEKDDK